METITQVRQGFWGEHPQFAKDYRKTYRQNQYNVDIRCAFVNYVDNLQKSGIISDKLADRVTL